MIDSVYGGVSTILLKQIAEIPDSVIAKSFIIIDEAHLALRDVSLITKLLKADRVLGLSATFGEELGLRNICETLSKKGAIVT